MRDWEDCNKKALEEVLDGLKVAQACLVSPEIGNNLNTARTMVKASRKTLEGFIKRILA